MRMPRYGGGALSAFGVRYGLCRWGRLHVYDKHRACELNKIMGYESLSNVGDMLLKERVEIDIFDVPCEHEQKLAGHPLCA